MECCLQKWVPQDGEVHSGRGLEDDMHVVNRICSSSLDAGFLLCMLNSDTSLTGTPRVGPFCSSVIFFDSL